MGAQDHVCIGVAAVPVVPLASMVEKAMVGVEKNSSNGGTSLGSYEYTVLYCTVLIEVGIW